MPQFPLCKSIADIAMLACWCKFGSLRCQRPVAPRCRLASILLLLTLHCCPIHISAQITKTLQDSTDDRWHDFGSGSNSASCDAGLLDLLEPKATCQGETEPETVIPGKLVSELSIWARPSSL